MKKLSLFLVITISVICTCLQAKELDISKSNRLMNLPEYKDIAPNNILFLDIIRYTEAGAHEGKIIDKKQIAYIYDALTRINILNESNMNCTDNTTIYRFTLNDGSRKSVEFECEWIVIDGKNYKFEVLPVGKK